MINGTITADELVKKIKSKTLIFDGGLGTNLQKKGLAPGQCTGEWNITHPEEIISLHCEYINAGADIIKLNTFGVFSFSCQEYEEIIEKAFYCAREAVKRSGRDGVLFAFDVSSTGKMLKPFGNLDFEDAVKYFGEIMRKGASLGADIILIETMNDCLETKAAVIAAKEYTQLPVFVTNTYGNDGKLVTGADVKTMAVMLEAMGVCAIGVNCGFGPDKYAPLIGEMRKYTSLPIIANPNAGLPKVEGGKITYDIGPDEFAEQVKTLYEAGADIFGGCCGTTPEYIAKVSESLGNLPLRKRSAKRGTYITSYTHAVKIGGRTVNIGERINPTGKPKLKAALREGNTEYLVSEGLRQEKAGVDILDVNVGLPEIDEPEMLCKVVKELQSVCDIPLQLDSAKPEALEKAMRIYAGKPLVNSINGKRSSMESILPLVKKYGGTVIALTLDENGIPSSAEGRVEIAKNILQTCKRYGISKKDVIFDPLTMTVSSDNESANVTLKAVKMLTDMGCRTSLGVSNISFGLPQREMINTVFLKKAKENGLSAAIMNPFMNVPDKYDEEKVCRLLEGKDIGCVDFIRYASSLETGNSSVQPQSTQSAADTSLKEIIISGLGKAAASKASELLAVKSPLDIIDGEIIPALDVCGKNFEAKKIYLPQLLMSADAASGAFDVLKKAMAADGTVPDKGDVILATVKGDIHDIGKNIVKVLLESYGFCVTDLGKDVPPETVVKTALEKKCRLVGLSALMTTTVPSMEETIRLLHEADKEIKVVVGGAVLNEEYALMIHADKYSPEAMDTVRYAQEFYKR